MKHVTGKSSKTTLTNVQDNDVQPNAVDLRLAKVFLIKPEVFVIDEEQKVHRGTIEIQPNEQGY